MRMTKKIHNLAKITQKYLNNKSNQYIENLESDNAGSSTPEANRRKISSINTSQHQHLLRGMRADFDQFFSLSDTPKEEKTENDLSFVTSYSYNLESETGHDISGDLPELFRLIKKLDNHLQQIELIALFQSKLIKTKRKRFAIIHFD